MWRFDGSDNGTGIPAADLHRAFGLFGHAHPEGACPGAGIGLALSKRIVEVHGGRIWVVTPRTRGAAVVFTMPDDPKPRPDVAPGHAQTS
jgi:signal transduction histidine kinase